MCVIRLLLSPIQINGVKRVQLIVEMNLGDGCQARTPAVSVHDLLPLLVRSEVEILRGGGGGSGAAPAATGRRARRAVRRWGRLQRKAAECIVECALPFVADGLEGIGIHHSGMLAIVRQRLARWGRSGGLRLDFGDVGSGVGLALAGGVSLPTRHSSRSLLRRRSILSWRWLRRLRWPSTSRLIR